ncbi:prenylcysteine oxidase 1-like [Dermatophagoides farinae]|uniref:prenylcysteine oxidase 1-like n=1 Tax=Dermatophagoides farinae TaxID=6954 RepID=UPI003F636907
MTNRQAIVAAALVLIQLLPFTYSDIKSSDGSFNAHHRDQLLTTTDEKLQQQQQQEQQQRTIRIAVIGGGVGGTAAAYFLNELLSKQQQSDLRHEITIYEKNYRLGGRLHTVNVDNNHYEAGGSIIHERNKYAADLMAKFGLKRRALRSDDRLCIYNGERFVFCESSWDIVTLIRLLRYYGLDLIRLQKQVTKVIDHFERIYRLQSEQHAYDQVSDLLTAMDSLIYNLTRTSYKHMLDSEYKLSEQFISQIVQSISLVNYGQTISIPALVGMVSFAGAGSQLYAIEGGNKLLPLHLAHFSQARMMLNTKVVSINYMGDHRFRIDSKRLDGVVVNNNHSVQSDIYDHVIIATPLASQTNSIQFNNLTKRNELINDIFDKYHMHRTVATFVKGQVLNKYKDLSILSCDIGRGGSFFTSLSKLMPVQNRIKPVNSEAAGKQQSVYKVFSNRQLDPHELYGLFEQIDDIQQINWFAYPDYRSVGQPLPPFRLRAGVYYLNAIEWAASAIEMSLIGAKNVALLVCHELNVCHAVKGNLTSRRRNRVEL